MAKIAVELHQALRERALHGAAGRATSRELAKGDGWRAADVICTSGPEDRPFEERHSLVSVAMVIAGTFQYRTTARPELMAPGAFLLGTPGHSFECAHEHGRGDRCISFHFAPSFFEHVTSSRPRFRAQRLPPLRASAALVARACAALLHEASWEEIAVTVAAHAVRLANDVEVAPQAPSAAHRVTSAIRSIERQPSTPHSLQQLASDAGLSAYHFLRTFTSLTGVTPHQFALRARLREAALRLASDDERVIDVALDCGFGDLSNFNRAFRSEFGASPSAYRRRYR